VQDAETVLLIEDEAEVRRLIARMLHASGFRVVEAADGREALSLIDGGLVPRVIVLDLWMPVSDGWEFLELARPRVPVIVISGVADPRASFPKCVVQVIRKPFDFPSLVAAIHRARDLPPAAG
jgi:CheY-like chemotaxis protein